MMDESVERKKFEIPNEFRNQLSSLQDQKVADGIRELCKQVEELVEKLGISDQYFSFVTDGDLSISWVNYWAVDRRATKSGTPEFMSRALFDAVGDYLHSPVDDLESCFWVSVWSVLFNKDNMEGQSLEETMITRELSGNRKDEAMGKFSVLSYDAEHSDITQRFQSVILEWWEKVQERRKVWRSVVLRNKPQNAGEEYFLPYFHRFALQGVVDVLQVLANHWDGEIGWESWKGSASST